jgi:hypothetical protein
MLRYRTETSKFRKVRDGLALDQSLLYPLGKYTFPFCPIYCSQSSLLIHSSSPCQICEISEFMETRITVTRGSYTWIRKYVRQFPHQKGRRENTLTVVANTSYNNHYSFYVPNAYYVSHCYDHCIMTQ